MKDIIKQSPQSIFFNGRHYTYDQSNAISFFMFDGQFYASIDWSHFRIIQDLKSTNPYKFRQLTTGNYENGGRLFLIVGNPVLTF